MYFLVIDNRENKLIEQIQKFEINNFCIEVKPLKIGDILIVKSDSSDFDIKNCLDEELFKNTILIFERKTCQDLLASVNDGRYREQKARLLANFSLNQICYLIENDISTSLNKYRKNGRQIVIGALVNKCFRDNIKMLKTANICETIEFLMNICKKIVSNPDFFEKKQTDENTEESNLNYTSCVKISKKENITRDSFGILSLTIIPGISHKIAGVIMDKYTSLNNLITAINNSFHQHKTYDNIITDIGNINISISGDKVRRLGQKSAQRLVEMLVG